MYPCCYHHNSFVVVHAHGHMIPVNQIVVNKPVFHESLMMTNITFLARLV